MSVAIVLVNRTLRVHDHPALHAAAERADAIVPLFVLDDEILRGPFAAPNRVGFLRESVADLRRSLRELGGDLVLRRGDPVAESLRVAREAGATALYATADVTGYARRRQERLAKEAEGQGLAVELLPGVSVVEPGRLLPAGGGDHFRVFTPYHRAWSKVPHRRPVPPPGRVTLPPGVDPGPLPALSELIGGAGSPHRAEGGERAGRQRREGWLSESLTGYGDEHHTLAEDGTSRLSPYLHFGCLSAAELAVEAAARPGGGPFVRQLCWRDFYHQVAAAFPAIATVDYRPRGDRWGDDEEAFAAWSGGRTGYPLVDAGLRQLAEEGWMHNRARLVTASFLVKDLRIDWRRGAAHFLRWLVDGDLAENSANWQWVAGTGNDTRPGRVLNPLRQAERFDPDGRYVRRWVPELAGLERPAIHRPWTLGADRLDELGYPAPLVDHRAAASALRAGGPSAARAGGDAEQAQPSLFDAP